jgi:hypothetical protein
MAFAPLDNPLERLVILPTAMNWRGNWAATVVSPTNSASYILDGKTCLLGGGDPQFNPDWIELSLPTTGVASVNAGVGMALDPLGTATNPILDNDGVITLTSGVGIDVDNTDTHNPIVNNDGVITVNQSTGIIVDNTDSHNPIIENDGVITVNQSTGILVDNTDPHNPVVENDGVITVNGTSGVNVDNTDPHNPIISNTGLLKVNAGTGISVTTLSLIGEQTISNIFIEPTLCFIEISGNTPAAGPNPLQTASPNDEVQFLLTFPPLATPSKFMSIVLDATKGGGFLMDFSGFGFYIDQQNITATSQIGCGFLGNKAGGGPPVAFDFPITTTNGGEIHLSGNNVPPVQNFVATGGQIYFDLATYRAVSVGSLPPATLPLRLYFKNITGVPLYATSFPRIVMCRYYPNGLE